MKPGDVIGAYRILSALGVGGMGEVYRARDLTLQRDVAIKVLPASMAGQARRLVRFEREARALAALNHPNIATVYSVEDLHAASGLGRALVMELVEGDDLSWRIRRGALSLPEALAIARQVADALAAAHDAGIVHRDLKPANIKIREDGTVKVLDFGLATSTAVVEEVNPDGGGADSGELALRIPNSASNELPPTLTLHGDLTEDGAVIGTAAYLAPEQARGRPVDRRADIWAFGVVLFEMLAGCRPFEASDATELSARILGAEPDWQRLPPTTPPVIRRLLARCLAKDRRRRLHDMSDVRLEIDDVLEGNDQGRPDGDAGRSRMSWLWMAVIGLGLLATGAVIGAIVSAGREALPSGAVHVGVDTAPAVALDAGGVHPDVVLPAAGARTALEWTPDGRALVFIGESGGGRQIYVRHLGSLQGRPVAGTEGARAFAISPSGDEVAFWAGGSLSRVKLEGGPVVRLCDVGVVNGIAWGTSRIVFVDAPGLSEIAPAGGPRRQLTQPPELVRQASPYLLPGDAALLYTEFEKQWTSGDEHVMVRSLSGDGSPRVLIAHGADARYLPSGHLTFLRQGTLFVVPFDVSSLTVRGDPVAVLTDVAQAIVAWDSDDLTLAGHYAVSSRGALAYVRSTPTAYPDRELVQIDRAGRVTSLGAPIMGYRNHIELDPDGSRLAVSVQTARDVRVFVYDVVRGSLSRMAESVAGEVTAAAWGRRDRLAIQVISGGVITAAVVERDSAMASVPVAHSAGFWASSWSPAGLLAGMKEGHVWVYAPGQPGFVPAAFAPTTSTDTQPTFSPDGAFLAYSADATGHPEVYVRPYPGPGGAVMVSVSGGSSPAWNPRGGEMFYVESGAGPARLMSVDMKNPMHPGSPNTLFSIPDGLVLGGGILTPYAVAPDGLHFYAARQLSGKTPVVTSINVALNWLDEVRTRAAAQSR